MMLAAALCAAWTGQGFAYSDAQMAVMSHIGQAIAGTKICSKVKMAEGAAALMLAAYEVKLDDPVIAAVVRSKISETVDAWSDRTEAAACAAVLALYGPDGSNVPGLLLLKK
ncbi:hypothetical protein [Mesorhizobium sp.]|uniref:hypothetical protein n=1 Tax=Mesorhizobium sp. TaxID=1871066 RepID=UPI0025801C85|nr:hypothetical protein [Mesorhizobium sp.]